MLTRRTLLRGALAALLWPRRLWAQPLPPSNLQVNRMAPAYIASSVAETIADASDTTIAVTLGAAVAVGDYIVGMAGWGQIGVAISTVTDDLGNTYTIQANKTDDTTNGQTGQTFFARVTAAGTPVITVTFASTTMWRRVIVAAYSGLANPAADGTIGNWQSSPGTGTDAVTSTAVTTTADGDLIVGFHQNTGSSSGNISAGTNFTRRNALEAIIALEDYVQPSAGSIAATFTISVNHASITHMAAFKAAAAGAADTAFHAPILRSRMRTW